MTSISRNARRSRELLTLEEYNNLKPRWQGYACYMQAKLPGSPIPDKNPYPKGSQQAREWLEGAQEAVMEAQESDEC